MTAQTLPDDPNYAFCPSYDLGDEPQQIRIVFEGVDGYVPTALVALTVICCAQHMTVYVAVAGMLRWSKLFCSYRDLARTTAT